MSISKQTRLVFSAGFACCLLLVTPFAVVSDTIPKVLSYHGTLTDRNGVPVQGPKMMTFRLYKDPTGGASLWEEPQTVTLEEGQFTVLLGTVTPLTLPFDCPYWLSVSIEGGPELTPRRPLTAAPYSLGSQWKTKGKEIYYLDGHVGIGTSSPNTTLDVVRAGTQIRFSDFAAGPPNNGGGFLSSTGAEHAVLSGGAAAETGGWTAKHSAGAGMIEVGPNIKLYTDTGLTAGMTFTPTERMRITSAGNVGIGTTNPKALLHVDGSASTDRSLNLLTLSGGSYARIRLMMNAGDPQDRNWGIMINDASAGGDFALMQSTTHDGDPMGGIARLLIDQSGNVGIGTTSPQTKLHVVGDVLADAYRTASSKRWKTNIQPIESPLDKIRRLRGVTYDWKADGKHDIGLIAEEVGEVIPEVVAYEKNGVDAKAVDYARLVALLIEAIKEQQQKMSEHQVELAAIQELKREKDALAAENEALRTRLGKLEAVVSSLAERLPNAPQEARTQPLENGH